MKLTTASLSTAEIKNEWRCTSTPCIFQVGTEKTLPFIFHLYNVSSKAIACQMFPVIHDTSRSDIGEYYRML
jgi:hypothetical protein